MKAISKLKDEARKYEQREAWESAIQAYRQVLAVGEEGEGELEIALYNRVGDLYVRLNRSRDAVQYYEQAADRYADAGLFNNAIALCNKALRYMPDRAELLLKLGQFSAAQGFLTDARRYFAEYADKQFAAGNHDAALKALEELVQVAEDPELRELAGHRLHAHGRVAEALVHLKIAYEQRVQAGHAEQAQALRREIMLIDPDALSGARPGSAALDARASVIGPADPQGSAALDSRASIIDPAGQPGSAALDAPGSVDDLADGPDSAAQDPLASLVGPVDPPDSPALAARASALDPADRLDVNLTEPTATPDAEPDFGGFIVDDLSLSREPDGGVPDEPVDLLDGFESTTFEGFGGLAAEPIEGLDLEGSEAADVASVDIPGLERPESFDSGEPAADRIDDLEREASFAPPPTSDLDEGPGLELPLLPGDAEPEPAEPLPLLSDELDPDTGFPESPLPLLDETDDLAAGAAELPLLGDEQEAEALPPFEEEWPELPAIGEPEELAGSRPAADVDAATGDPPGPTSPFASLDGELDDALADSLEAERRALDDVAWHVADYAPGSAKSEAPEVRHGVAPREVPPEPEAPAFEAEGPISEPEAPVSEPRDPAASADAMSAAEAATEPPSAREDYAPPPAAAEAAREPQPAVPDQATPPEPPSRRPEYVDLAALLNDPEPDQDTRFVVQEKAPTGDEDEDFAELLSQFKQKVAEHVSVEDAAAHYDLGLAFKEMGLIDEAIGEFQVALRAGDMRLKVYEELGQCFLLKGQYNIAEKVLRRALESRFDDELELLGVYYHLGRACEELGKREAARDAYERVLGLDINFADVAARLARL